MPTREELHQLVDTLPEGAMEAAHKILTAAQVWPPPRQPLFFQMRTERRTEWRAAPGAGFGGNYNPEGSSSRQYLEGDTIVTETMRRQKGYELRVIERVREDGQRLIYKHEVTGPGEKRDEREIVFDLA
jgi:hypothetical protein